MAGVGVLLWVSQTGTPLAANTSAAAAAKCSAAKRWS